MTTNQFYERPALIVSCGTADLDSAGSKLPDQLAVPGVHQRGQVQGRAPIEGSYGGISLKWEAL